MKVRLSKRLMSLILTVVMVVSMIAVGVVNVTSAEADISATGDSVIEVWFTRPNSWGNNPNVHYWGGSSSSSWPGKGMTWKYNNDYGQGVYYTTVPGDTKQIIFNNGSGSYQTVDISISGSVVAYYVNGNETSTSATVKAWDKMPDSLLEPITYSLTIDSSSVDVTNGPATVNLPAGSHIYFVLKKQGSASIQVKKGAYNATAAGTYQVTYDIESNTCTFTYVVVRKMLIAIADDTGDRWLGSDDAHFKVVANGAATSMKKSVDVASGLNIWYAEINEVSSGTSVKFQRCSAIDESTVWNTWTTSFVSGSPLYKIGDEDVITPSSMLEIPDGSVTNFGYGIWVDTKGNADTKDFVKIFANDFVKETKYTLYLPAYTDWTQLKVYTNFPSLSIDGRAVTKGQVNTLNLSTNGIERTVNISFKRHASGSTHSGTLHIMRAGTASTLLMTTNDDLYTGLTAAYADNGDGTANYEGVAAYKSLISTKGKFAFYTNYGEKLNTDDGLKKVKPRGNSTFEASMRLYGKTAYNITLNEKAQLIEGCASSKKYSLLANNADESLMRNMTVYGIADAVGMPYTPNTRLIDLYDNGTYLGAYVLTEKVEYGKNTLIPEAKSSDKLNEEILAAGKGIDYDNLKQVTGTYTAKSGTVYQYQYSVASEAGKTYEFDGSTVTIGEGEEAVTYTLDESLMKKYDFLIEHEINGRYQPEATWFVSGRTKQAVVPKYPEFATQKQAQWMIEQYDAMETAAYTDNYTAFAALADVESFASVYLIQELTENLDAGATSYYILGGKNFPKLLAAPIWDYDWAAGMYNGKKLTTDGEVDVADFTQRFVTKKSVKIAEDDGRTQSTPNLQARLTRMSQFWTVCKTVWTNKFTPVLNDTLGDGKTILATYLPQFRTAAYMNEDRWNVLHKMNANPENYWGTRSTTQYKKGGTSKTDFAVGGNKCTGATFNYDNTVYYLNDWLTQRRSFMDTTLGLYDPSLLVPDPVAYLDDKGVEQTTDQYTEIDSSMSALTSGWYAVTEDASHSGIITVSGDVSLILCDGAELTVPNGIQLSSGSSLTIYGQSEGTGTLRCEWDMNEEHKCCGISTVQEAVDCAFTINGGTVIAKASRDNFFVGIGAYKESSAEITINGGTVTASGGNSGTGIGASYYSSADITINGGTVTTSSIDSCTSTGIGSNQKGDMTVTINGGTVCDTSTYSNCISIGAINGPGQVVINGGTVNASKMIGRDTIGDVTVTINGGIISSPYYAIKAKAINLSWTNESDSITVNSYYGTVTLKKAFTDGTNTYLPGVISDNSVLRATTLTPSTATAGTYLLGDADGNGQVNIMDATCIQRYLAGFTVSSFDEKAASVTGDAPTIMAATAIQRFLAGFSTSYSVGSEFSY